MEQGSMDAGADHRCTGRAVPDGAQADVLVIGAGAIGLWTSVKLAERGARVVVLDRDEPGTGASFGNAGLLTPSLSLPLARPGAVRQALRWTLSPSSPFTIHPSLDPSLAGWLLRFAIAGRKNTFERNTHAMVRLCLASMDDWRALDRVARPTGIGLSSAGLLALYESEESHGQGLRLAELTGRSGVRWESWGADRLRDEEPIVSDPIRHAIHYPHDGFAEPDRAMHRLRAHAIGLGVRIIDRSPVRGLLLGGDRVRAIQTPSCHLRADDIVIAAGVWTGGLARQLGLKIPMRSAKGYSMLLPRGRAHPRRAMYLAQHRVTVTPHDSLLRLAGTLEICGDDRSINHRRADAILRGATRILRIPPPDRRPEVWAGLRPCLSDGMPMIGRLARFSNIWVSTGHQMTGFKCAPASAQIIAEQIGGEASSMELAPFAPSRFGL